MSTTPWTPAVGAATSATMTIPGTPSVGDWMILVASIKTTSVALPAVSGWSKTSDIQNSGTGLRWAVYSKQYAAGDANPVFSWGASFTYNVIGVTYGGRGSALDGTPATADNGATASTNVPVAAYSTASDGDLIVAVLASRGNANGAQTYSPPSGFTIDSQASGSSGSTNNLANCIASMVQTTHGTVGPETFTSNISNFSGSGIFAIKAAGGSTSAGASTMASGTSLGGSGAGPGGNASMSSATSLAGAINARSGQPKVWNGTSWVSKPSKYWNGTTWVAKPAKAWNGSSMVLAR